MSESIDRRVVEMRFDNKDFEQNVNTTMTVLDKLKEKLSFKGAGDKFESASGLGSAIDGVKSRFSALEIIGTTALINLTNSAVNLGKQMAKSLTVDQVRAGFAEYELKMGSIQTIMASTGKDIGTVNGYLNELNTYADKTIYSFSDMTSSIGKFTNAGVDLDTAVKAIQGISNEAAVSGANAQEASRAMYNFAQALSAGYVKLIDWKSIENANMATKEFKQQLIDTAVAEGTLEKAADGTYKVLTSGAGGGFKETITATKNFNDSLSAAWMTTDVLTKTLGRYSDATTDIGKKAFAAAQDVKTFSQLVDTIKESIGSGWAQTFELIFGNLEEAKRLWTGVNNVVSGFVDRTSDARNSALAMWKANIHGRAAFFDGLQNMYKALLNIAKPIKEAFSTVFPPNTLSNLIKFSSGFQRLTKSMILSEEAADKLRRIFIAVFNLLKIGMEIVKGVFKVFSSFAKLLLPIGKQVFNLLDEIAVRINVLPLILKDFKSGNAGSGIVGWLESLASASAVAAEKLGQLTGGILDKLGAISAKIGPAVGKLFSLIGKGLSHLDLGKLGALLAGGGILAAGMKIVKFFDTLGEKFENLFGNGEEGGGLMDGVKETFASLSETLNQFQTSLKVGQLLTVAVSLGILAASCATLADIPAKKLAVAVGAIGGLFVELGAASYLMKGAQTKGIIAMAIAVTILAKAVKQMSEIEDMGKGLLGVGAILGELTAFCLVFDKLKIRPRALKKTGEGLILMAVAINLLAKPIKELGAMDTGQLIQGLLAMASMLGGFTLTALAFSKIKTKGLIKAGAAMVIMATAMQILVKPLSELGAMDLASLAKGLGAMGVALIEIAGFTAIMSKIAATSGNIMKASAALLVMSVGIKIMAGAIQQMGADTNAGQGLSVLFGSLLILGAAMTAMQNSLAGAAAMIVVAGALAIMAPAIALLSSLNFTGVVTGLAALAGTLTIFGVGTMLLAPVIPLMIALAAAMALLGVGVLSLGAGMTLLVTAFAMATGPIVEGATAIAQAFPIMAEAIGEGIITVIKNIGEGAKTIADSLKKIVEAILKVLTDIIPDIVTVGLQFILALLNGINSNIGQIATVAMSILTNFINGISSGLPDLVNAGFNLMITFLNSMADAISTNGDKLANALLNVVLAAISAIVGLIPGVGKKGKEMIDSYRKGLDSGKAPAAKTAKNVAQSVEKNMKVKDQKSNGANAVRGLKNGMESLLPSLRSAANKVADIVDKTIRKKNQIKSPSRRLFATGSYMMQGLINGVDSLSGQYEKKADNIATMMIASANRSVDSVNSIFQNGFSNGFDLNNSIDRAVNVSLSMDKINDRNAELSKNISRLTSSLDGMTETMNSRSLNNYITVDGAADPELFADELINSFRLNARTV